MWVTQEPKNDMTPYAALSHFFHSRRIITSDYRDGGSPNNFTQASNISLLFLMVLMVVLNFSNVVGLFGSGGLLASLILVIVSAAGAYLLGSLGRAQKWVQTFGAGQRNIAAAMVVATMNFGNDEVVMVVVYSLITLLIMTPLALELGKRRPKAAEAGEELDAAPVSN